MTRKFVLLVLAAALTLGAAAGTRPTTAQGCGTQALPTQHAPLLLCLLLLLLP